MANLKESADADNPHVANLSTSINGPLYMESEFDVTMSVAIVMIMFLSH